MALSLTSVVIPTYNRAAYLPLTVESALNQEGAEVEVIVVDDGSTDETAAIIEQKKNTWGQRFRYVWQENAERSVARNHGLRLARGEFVAFLDSDDLFRPHHVSMCVKALADDAELAAAFGDHGLIDASGNVISQHVRRPAFADDRFKREICLKQLIIFPGEVLIRRAALEDIFGTTEVFDPDAVMLEEWLLWVTLLCKFNFRRVGHPTVWRRLHPNSTWGDPETFERQSARVTEKVIGTGLPASLGIPSRRVRAINRTHCAYGYYLSGQWSLALHQLGEALREYPSVVRERHFWSVAARLGVGKRLSRRIRQARHLGRGNLITEPRPKP
ncbi:MAG TPA: glycosyltransferase family A protein [Pyrinomonadaceae bacterium]|nr:glycosyltransferase family A protein [Pyrinomonadaceae bacterium]